MSNESQSDDSKPPKEWTALIRKGKVIWDPNQALPLQAGDIWLYRVEENFALGFVGNAKQVENKPPVTMIIANFDGMEALVKVINYLTGKGPKT